MAIPFENTLGAVRYGSLRAGWWLGGLGFVLLAFWLFVAVSIALPVTVSSADGRAVSATDSLEITSVSSEPLATIPYQLGDRVNAGDLLFAFDAEALELELARSRERLAALKAEVESVDREIVSIGATLEGELSSFDMAAAALAARIEETHAELDYALEAEFLYRQMRAERQIDALKHARAETEVSRLRLRLEAQEAEASELLAKRGLATSRTETTRAQLMGQRARLTGDIAELEPEQRRIQLRIEELSVRAPFDGEVGAMARVSVGESLQPGEWLMTLVPSREYEFQATFAAREAAGRLQAEQPARIRFFALPWTEYGTLNARVLRVSSEERNGTVQVDFAVDKNSPLAAQLNHGLKGQVVVQIDKATLTERLFWLLNRPAQSPLLALEQSTSH
ncbi:MAG: HlyD family efflux transporter periplasmic adaptor subunit [Pseudomonadota bacterium]